MGTREGARCRGKNCRGVACVFVCVCVCVCASVFWCAVAGFVSVFLGLSVVG